jgi:hypothetical protein
VHKYGTNITQRKLRTGIRNIQGLIIEPALRFLGVLIENLVRCILVPVIGLSGIGVRDAAGIYPIIGLLVLRVVDLGGRIDWGIEILKKVTTVEAFTIEQDIISVIGAGMMLIQEAHICE